MAIIMLIGASALFRSLSQRQGEVEGEPMSQRRRLLALLADSDEGCTEDLLRAHGFKLDDMVDAVNAGLATATAERMLTSGKSVEVSRVRITAAGRVALERS